MGQKIFTDKIGQLSFNSPTISMLASRITIGGQQYVTSTLTVGGTGLSAATLYCIYAVLSGGVVTLVTSTNMPSTGPVGFTSWALVGAFVTGATTTAFAGFVPIDASIRLTSNVRRSTNQTIPNASDTQVQFNTFAPTMDPFSMYDSVGFGIRTPLAGLWKVSANAIMVPTTALYALTIGVLPAGRAGYSTKTANPNMFQSVALPAHTIITTAGQLIQLLINQSSGGNLDIQGDGDRMWMEAEFVSFANGKFLKDQ